MEVQLNRHDARISTANRTATAAHTAASVSNPIVSGAVGQVVAGNFGFTTTTTSITFYWDGTNGSVVFVLQFSDGSTHTVPKGSLAVTGLTSATSYRFYPYYSQGGRQVFFATGGTGTPSAAFTSANSSASGLLIRNGNISLVTGTFSVATPGSGTGGGSGGGGRFFY